jgi:ABC-type Fe3+-hydroxamate transport system substrate-binding protein
MRGWIIAALAPAFVLGLAACGDGRGDEPQVHVSAAGECAVRAAYPWNAGGITLSVEATTTGPDCALANATLTIRNAAGRSLWAEEYPTARVMGLADATSPTAMETALTAWISAQNTTIPTAGALPDWPQSAQFPPNGEFPFYPEEGVSRADYMALRNRNAPLYCYVQGMESLACLAYENGELTKIGVQTFPG